MSEATLIWRGAAAEGAAFEFRHPLDPTKGCRMAPLSRMAGLKAVAVNLVTVAPGRQAFPHHVHYAEEEWVFVVSGTAEVRIGDENHALGSGDFAAFPNDGPAHSVRNSGVGDLVCLMGGQRMDAKVIDFPDLGKRVTWTSNGMSAAPLEAFTEVVAPRGEEEGDP